MIYIIRKRATPQQLTEMLVALEVYVKLAVDVRRGILAGGGTLHADCEAILLEDGSRQVTIQTLPLDCQIQRFGGQNRVD